MPVETEPEMIFVDVCGAVMNPGVYELDGSSRVFQAIEAAGGFLPEAAASAVNQAQPVSDGQQIYVPTQTSTKIISGSVSTGISDSSASADIFASARSSVASFPACVSSCVSDSDTVSCPSSIISVLFF